MGNNDNDLSGMDRMNWFLLASLWSVAWGIIYGGFFTKYPPKGRGISLSVAGGMFGVMTSTTILQLALTRKIGISLIPAWICTLAGIPVLVMQYFYPPDKVPANPHNSVTEKLIELMGKS